MDRRQFCRSTVAAGVAAAFPHLTGCGRDQPVATEADTSIAAISLDGAEIELEKSAIRELGARLTGRYFSPAIRNTTKPVRSGMVCTTSDRR